MTQASPKIVPTKLDFKTLFDPQVNYPYFSDASSHKFRPKAQYFELVNAWWMAEFSLLAYLRSTSISRHLANVGAELAGFLNRRGTQGLIASFNDFIVVAFRGTEVQELADLITDARIRLVAVKPAGAGKVHEGFQRALDGVWSEAQEKLAELQKEKARPVWFTGHSLGGALAILASHRYAGIQGVYTFGAPRVGNAEFAGSFSEAHYRFVNNNDLVTMVPPEGVYSHVGSLKYLDTRGMVHDSPRVWRILQDRFEGHCGHFSDVLQAWSKGQFAAIPSDGLRDHAPIYYAVKIWNAYARASW